jgi:predicted DNA-binding transcriptional regulator YafY
MDDHEQIRERTAVSIYYRNHRGETSWRHIAPQKIWWGETEWHKGRQWLLQAWDLDKNAMRDFALADVLKWIDDRSE